MTTAKKAPVGSAQWIQTERDHVDQLVDQEVEEFGYSVRNEFEWLNEHMGEVFNRNNLNFADVFKTPGKLRGKTPRTARKRDTLASRQPLTDIFAPTTELAPPTASRNAFYDKVAHFQIAEDNEGAPLQRPKSRDKSLQRLGQPGNTDSGYHGMTEDEMESDARAHIATTLSQQSNVQMGPLREDQAHVQFLERGGATKEGRNSDESFASAKEDLVGGNVARIDEREEQGSDEATVPDEEMEVDPSETGGETPAAAPAIQEVEEGLVDQEMDEEAPQSPSDASISPEKPLQRKSSFTFAALPAREPITAKRSIGGRNSQMDTDRNSVFGRSKGGKSIGFPRIDDEAVGQDKVEDARVHSKTSTMSLHERIKMLGKTKELRTSRSIPQSVLDSQALYPQLPAPSAEVEAAAALPEVAAKEDLEEPAEEVDDDDDDWIAPSKPAQAAQQKSVAQPALPPHNPQSSPERPPLPPKTFSATSVQSPARQAMHTAHQKAQSTSIPNLANAAGTIQSTTPAGSPMGKKYHDGPLSASKNKLWSALKSAKSIFASSASASAAAKLEARNHAAAPNRSPKRDFTGGFRMEAVFTMPGALYSEAQLPQSPSRTTSVQSGGSSVKTRSELKAQQKAAEELEKAREKERQKAIKLQAERRMVDEAEASKQAEVERQQAIERPVSAATYEMDDTDMPPPPPPKSMLPAGKLRAPGRLARPTREQPATRPAPVSIRVASQSQRMGQVPQSSMSRSQHEGLAPPPPPKTGLRTASAQANVRGSTAPVNARTVKALEAAARKKEQDERAAQKKADQKRELERKRAAKVEEERRIEEERRAVAAQETKLAALWKAEQQAVEARKREQQRAEQQRRQDEEQKAKSAHDLAEAIKRERAAQPPSARGDIGGTLRQLAKNTVAEHSTRPAMQSNPAKPAKRGFQQEDDESQQLSAPQRPGLQKGPASYQQNDAKRRRTIEEQEERVERHSVMAPPKRPSNMSNMRKESTLNKFPHGYTNAPPPATHHTSSIFKATVTAQHQLQHSSRPTPGHPGQLVQMSNARIPFAENANPPATAQPATYQPTHHGTENTQPGAAAPNKFKTPGRPAQAPKSAKSSPMYPKGDTIELPEIQTDSEDEASSDEEQTGGFRAPSWVASPALRDLLTQQQLVDPETVFGPIAELKMEEVFKNGKNGDRLKRFRDRGSSAAWIESGDAVTSAEKRRDMEMRERVVREGGWRYEPNA